MVLLAQNEMLIMQAVGMEKSRYKLITFLRVTFSNLIAFSALSLALQYTFWIPIYFICQVTIMIALCENLEISKVTLGALLKRTSSMRLIDARAIWSLAFGLGSISTFVFFP